MAKDLGPPAPEGIVDSQSVVDFVRVDSLFWGPRGGPDILHDISFGLREGQILAICGANGAGKSTLLRMIYRNLAPRMGSVRLNGRDIWAMTPRAVAREVAVVLQDSPADFALSVRQIVGLGRLPHAVGLAGRVSAHDQRAIDQALATLDLLHLADRSFVTLSGGERQRAMVARALAQEPRLLVLDEPTNHLDIRHQLELLSLLRQLGLTVITTLHDLNMADDLADRLLLLSEGRIVADGPPHLALTGASIAKAFAVQTRTSPIESGPRFSFHI